MKPGKASETSVMVCMARAAAHGKTNPRFSDPTALALLPDEARKRVERYRAGSTGRGLRGRMNRSIMMRRATMMVVRTIAIDDAVRSSLATKQVIILGAGLDGRAWRMPELQNSIVFEVDHPDTQKTKRERAAALSPQSRDIRFVPVDFTRDDLGAALQAAGHDPTIPTTWIWEGVVMYLTMEQIEASLTVIQRRSANKSRLIIAYFQPGGVLRHVIGLLLRRIGEPLRSSLTAAQMRTLLGHYAFVVGHDEDLPTLGDAMSPELGAASSALKHLRIVTADRPAS